MERPVPRDAGPAAGSGAGLVLALGMGGVGAGSFQVGGDGEGSQGGGADRRAGFAVVDDRGGRVLQGRGAHRWLLLVVGVDRFGGEVDRLGGRDGRAAGEGGGQGGADEGDRGGGEVGEPEVVDGLGEQVVAGAARGVVVGDGDQDGQADGEAHLVGGGGHAGGDALTLGRDAGGGGDPHRGPDDALAEAGDQDAGQEHGVGAVGGHRDPEDQHARGADEGAGEEGRTEGDPVDQALADLGADGDDDGERQ